MTYWRIGRRQPRNKGAWRCLVMVALSNVKECMETKEKERKNIMKQRREEAVQSESLALKGEVTGRGFVGLSVGLGW